MSFLFLQKLESFWPLVIQWFLSLLWPPKFSRNYSTFVTFFPLNFLFTPQNSEIFSCLILPIDTNLLNTLVIMSLRPLLFLLPTTGYSCDSRPFWKLSIIGSCGSPDSPTTYCQTLVPCVPFLPGLQTGPLLSFATQLGQTLQHSHSSVDTC